MCFSSDCSGGKLTIRVASDMITESDIPSIEEIVRQACGTGARTTVFAIDIGVQLNRRRIFSMLSRCKEIVDRNHGGMALAGEECEDLQNFRSMCSDLSIPIIHQ
jgi:hypothetical protein